MKSSFLGIAALVVVACLISPIRSYAVGLEFAVYDSITNTTAPGGFGATGTNPRTFIGDVFNLSNSLASPVSIQAVDLGFAYRGASTTFSSLTVNLRFYNDSVAVANTPILANPATGIISVDVRQQIVDVQNLANGTNFSADSFVFAPGDYIYQLVLPTAFSFSDINTNGIAVNYAGVAATPGVGGNDLTSVLRTGNAIVIGSRGLDSGGNGGGFLRDTTSRADFNFNQGDLRNVTLAGSNQNTGLAMRLYSSVAIVPETSGLNLLALGGLVTSVSAIMRRRKK